MIQLLLAGFVVATHTEAKLRRLLTNQNGSKHSNNSQTKYPKGILTGLCPHFNSKNKPGNKFANASYAALRCVLHIRQPGLGYF